MSGKQRQPMTDKKNGSYLRSLSNLAVQRSNIQNMNNSISCLLQVVKNCKTRQPIPDPTSQPSLNDYRKRIHQHEQMQEIIEKEIEVYARHNTDQIIWDGKIARGAAEEFGWGERVNRMHTLENGIMNGGLDVPKTRITGQSPNLLLKGTSKYIKVKTPTAISKISWQQNNDKLSQKPKKTNLQSNFTMKPTPPKETQQSETKQANKYKYLFQSEIKIDDWHTENSPISKLDIQSKKQYTQAPKIIKKHTQSIPVPIYSKHLQALNNPKKELLNIDKQKSKQKQQKDQPMRARSQTPISILEQPRQQLQPNQRNQQTQPNQPRQPRQPRQPNQPTQPAQPSQTPQHHNYQPKQGDQLADNSMLGFRIYPCDLTKDTIKTYIADRLISVAKIDAEFQAMKWNFVNLHFQEQLTLSQKKFQLLRILWERGLFVDEKNLEELIDFHLDPELQTEYQDKQQQPQQGFPEFLDIFVNKYLQTQHQFNKRVVHMVTSHETTETGFKASQLDLQGKGYLKIQDLACFINLNASNASYVKNRQIKEIFWRFCRFQAEPGRLSFQGFMRIIERKM